MDGVCIICGDVVPEGINVCRRCRNSVYNEDNVFKYRKHSHITDTMMLCASRDDKYREEVEDAFFVRRNAWQCN